MTKFVDIFLALILLGTLVLFPVAVVLVIKGIADRWNR